MSSRGRHSSGDSWPPDDDPFVGLLRDAMHRQVDGYYPAGDGLQRIQGRVARRQRWMTFRPVLAAVALASVIALVAIGVSLVPGSKNPRTTLADDDQLTASSTAASSASATDGPVLMMWPYANADQAAENAGNGDGPDLTDPVATTQGFIDSMFPGAGLTAGTPTPTPVGVNVPIEAPTGQVGEAQLQEVPANNGAAVFGLLSITNEPSGDNIVLGAVATPEDGLVEVGGKLSNEFTQTATAVNVSLYSAGQATPTAQSEAPIEAGSRTWSTELHVPTSVSLGFVLAWSEDAAGTPQAIAAVPIGSGQSSSPAPTGSEQASASDSGSGAGSSGPHSPSDPTVQAPPPGTGSPPPTQPADPSTPPSSGPTTPPSSDPSPPPSSEPSTPPSSESPEPPTYSTPEEKPPPPAISQPTNAPSAS